MKDKCKKLKEMIDDEDAGATEYLKAAQEDPEDAEMFIDMATDEIGHMTKLKKKYERECR